MTLSGVNASWTPKIMHAQDRRGLEPRYMVRTKNMMSADMGSEMVVGVGFGLMVTTTK